MNSIVAYFLLAFLLIVIAWLTVAADTAIDRLSKAHIAEIEETDPRKAARLQSLAENPARYVNALLLLRSLTSLGAFAFLALALLDLLSWPSGWVLTLATVIMAVVSFVVLGVSARTTGRQRTYTVASATAWFVRPVTAVIHPITALLIHLGNAITPGPGFRTGPFSSQAEFAEVLDAAEASRVIEAGERQMIRSVFALGDTIAREVMVPRTDMVFIESDKNLRQALSLGLRSGYSRIPVVGEDPDDMLGVVFLKDIVRRVFEDRSAELGLRVADLMRPVHFVPDSKPADDLLGEMQAKREHMAIVVDEFGGTAGLVTIEDILEEIVGEIDDEYDTSAPDVERISDGELVLSSRLSIEHLMEETGIDLDPEEESVETVGGLMGRRLGRVPIPGAQIEEQGWRFKAQAGTGRRNQVTSIRAVRIGAEE
ncbi:MAG: HlyC/CorC family transporter [Actinobacteria bacterium]|nr:HlyC/CorC family transporter [Actinomycetota bacterium]